MAKGRYEDLTECRLTIRSSPGEKECAPWLPLFMAVPAILGFCVKYQRQRVLLLNPQNCRNKINCRNVDLRWYLFLLPSSFQSFYVRHIPPKVAYHACASGYLMTPGMKYFPGKPASRGSSFIILSIFSLSILKP